MAKWPWDQHPSESEEDYRDFCAWRDGTRLAGPRPGSLLWLARAEAYDRWRGPIGPEPHVADLVREKASRSILRHLEDSERTGILDLSLKDAMKLAFVAGGQKDRRDYAASESDLRRIYSPQPLTGPPGLANMTDEELWELRRLQEKARGEP